VRFYQLLKNIYHLLSAHCWRWFYGRPDKSITLYGITGTNGKTTTAYILAGILSAVHTQEKVGLLTTVAIRVGKKETVNKTKMTTLPSRQVWRYLKQMKAGGVTHAVIEMTSHALDQNRLHGLKLAGAIILNLAREHLDYHRTMPAYAAAKQKIINYLEPQAPLVGKADDEAVNKILAQARAQRIAVHAFTSAQAQTIDTPLIGDINKENALAASLLAGALGVKPEQIRQGISEVKAVPGRMEFVRTKTDFRILIDYAVTPDALARLYADMRGQTKGKIIAVLGAAGLRDRGKRPAMAGAVAQYADEIILTREDPWTEPEEQIFSDLEKGLRDTSVTWQKIIKRRQAIRYAISQARADDLVIITGKGAETGMGFANKVIAWNDREVITKILEEFE